MLAEALEEKNVNAKRIKVCEYCGRLYYAKRLDQTCCTPGCARAYRAFKNRMNYSNDPVGYKLRRIAREEKKLKRLMAAAKQGEEKR